MMELEALQAVLPQIRDLGVSLVAISPQPPSYGRAVRRRASLEFDVLSDEGSKSPKLLAWCSRCRPTSRSFTGHSAKRLINFTGNRRIAFRCLPGTPSTGTGRFAAPT